MCPDSDKTALVSSLLLWCGLFRGGQKTFAEPQRTLPLIIRTTQGELACLACLPANTPRWTPQCVCRKALTAQLLAWTWNGDVAPDAVQPKMSRKRRIRRASTMHLNTTISFSCHTRTCTACNAAMPNKFVDNFSSTSGRNADRIIYFGKSYAYESCSSPSIRERHHWPLLPPGTRSFGEV